MNGKKVLFIDNDDFFKKLYRQRLEEKGIDFLEITNGNDVIDLVKEEKPNLIVTEIILPGKGGFNLIKKLNEDNELKNIPVVVLTKLSQNGDMEVAMDMGVDAYFVKSEANLSEVMEKIEEILNKK